MKIVRLCKATIVALACVQLVLPLRAWADQPPSAPRDNASVIRDIALGARGRLQGQLLDAQGQPLRGQRVTILQSQRALGKSTSDENGYFQVEGLQGGVYQLATQHGSVFCRCWVADTAPPSASDQLLLVADKDLQRGQQPFHKFFTNPLLLGLIIAGAVAIPIAVHNSGS